MVEEYKSIYSEGYELLIEDKFSVAKPKNIPSGYKVEPSVGRDPDNPKSKKMVKGWKLVKKGKTAPRRGHISKAKARQRAKKGAKTRKKDIRGQKIAKKKALATRKARAKFKKD